MTSIGYIKNIEIMKSGGGGISFFVINYVQKKNPIDAII